MWSALEVHEKNIVACMAKNSASASEDVQGVKTQVVPGSPSPPCTCRPKTSSFLDPSNELHVT